MEGVPEGSEIEDKTESVRRRKRRTEEACEAMLKRLSGSQVLFVASPASSNRLALCRSSLS